MTTLFKPGETVRSRFGPTYTIIKVLPNAHYVCKRVEDGAEKIIPEINLRREDSA